MIPHDEAGSVVWTDEMAEAFGIAGPLLARGDTIAARMAFRETYQAAVSRARDQHRPPVWRPSMGVDPAGRALALREAIEKGRLSVDHATLALPNGRFTESDLAPPDYVQRLTALLSEQANVGR